MQSSLKFFFITDTHIGYDRKINGVSERYYESFFALEESLITANNYESDFVILGGDIFDSTKKTNTQQSALVSEIISSQIYSGKYIKYANMTPHELVTNSGAFNYEHSNLNISLPIYAIYGNHDQHLTGNKSPLAVLASANLINLMDKIPQNDEVLEIYPLVLEKNSVRLAIYFLSHIEEEKFYKYFSTKSVIFHKPSNVEFTYTFFIYHQNSETHHSFAKIVAPSFILKNYPEIDFLLFGHEHNSRFDPLIDREFILDKNSNLSDRIINAGSALQTQLANEHLKSNVGLEITDEFVKLTIFPLFTQQIILKSRISDVVSGDSISLVESNINSLVSRCQELQNSLHSLKSKNVYAISNFQLNNMMEKYKGFTEKDVVIDNFLIQLELFVCKTSNLNADFFISSLNFDKSIIANSDFVKVIKRRDYDSSGLDSTSSVMVESDEDQDLYLAIKSKFADYLKIINDSTLKTLIADYEHKPVDFLDYFNDILRKGLFKDMRVKLPTIDNCTNFDEYITAWNLFQDEYL